MSSSESQPGQQPAGTAGSASQPAVALKVLLSTAPDPETAEKIARTLVHEKFAACAQVLHGVKSFYRWQGRLEHADECLLVIKTVHAAACLSRLREMHPYEVPEGLVLPVEDGLADYLDWARRNGDVHDG
jgi:periplasmic divalent cation tolerance protein